jgi:hypothetical protein
MKTEYRDDELIVNYTEAPFSGTGIVSQVMWDNPGLQVGLRRIFNCKYREQIIAVVVNDKGIKAYFENKQ